MNWFNIFKPEKKLRPMKLTKWEELYYAVVPAKDVQTTTIEAVCSDSTLISLCEGWVFYLEDGHNAVANALFSKYYEDIVKRFKQEGYSFFYAPKEAEKVAKHYAMPMPGVEWNAATLLEMLHCRIDEPIGSALMVIDVPENADEASCTVRLSCISLDADSEEGVVAILKAFWEALAGDSDDIRFLLSEDDCVYESSCEDGYASETRSEESAKLTKYYGADKESVAVEPIEERCCTAGDLFSDDGESGERRREEALRRRDEAPDYKRCKRKKEQETFLSSITKRIKSVGDSLEALADDFLNEEEQLSDTDQQLLKEIQERVEKLRQRGIKQHLIDQFVKMTVQKSHLQVTADARILLTDYRKEVQMLPIDKVVYIFFLRHPEGVTLKALSDHKEELLGLYARVLGKTKLTDKQKASVERLCDPWDNSINEKLSRIRTSFCAEVHESVANHYVIQGSRGEDRTITLEEELIVADEWLR